jgi:hypothetical protein
VKDKLDNLIPWVKRVMETFAEVDPDVDDREKKRREELARFTFRLEFPDHQGLILCSTLEDIGNRSLALSEKGKLARVLDKARDSGKVTKLIEEVKEAIAIYQVGAGPRKSNAIDVRKSYHRISLCTNRSPV